MRGWGAAAVRGWGAAAGCGVVATCGSRDDRPVEPPPIDPLGALRHCPPMPSRSPRRLLASVLAMALVPHLAA
ncbi:MAG: hypothetical protein M3680_18225, partial [Myxococcota bacterium]|nr:hypothetical protein [Myxococcota bacterium]